MVFPKNKCKLFKCYLSSVKHSHTGYWKDPQISVRSCLGDYGGKECIP